MRVSDIALCSISLPPPPNYFSGNVLASLLSYVNTGTFNSSYQMVLDVRKPSQETMLSVFELLSSELSKDNFLLNILYIMLVNGIDVEIMQF